MKYKIATIGSHSALQILKGAKDEGFNTLLYTTKERVNFYRRFSFIDEIVNISSYQDISNMQEKNIILIPHGSFVAHLGIEGNKNLKIPYFGNKKVLDYEADRKLQQKWLAKSQLNLPQIYNLHDQNIKKGRFFLNISHDFITLQ